MNPRTIALGASKAREINGESLFEDIRVLEDGLNLSAFTILKAWRIDR
jgi:hypothetical protein